MNRGSVRIRQWLPSRRAIAVVGIALVALLATACVTRASPRTSPQRTSTTAAHQSGQGNTPSTVATPVGSTNVYSHTLAGMWAPATRGVPYLIYAPDSQGSGVDVIDPTSNRVIRYIATGATVQHVVPAWDLRTLYATNDDGNSLTPIDPHTGDRAGPNIPVPDPYNLYFTPDGKHAIVVEEAMHVLSFRDPHTFAMQRDVSVDCSGVDHMDFSADGSFLIASCEFSGQLVRIDLNKLDVTGYINVGGMPQDVKLSPDGTIFYVANMQRAGVSLIDANSFQEVGFIPTGYDAHGLYVSRDTKDLYVTNRRSGSISVIDFATRRVVATWSLPGQTPDMGNVSPDGTVLWLGGRYTGSVYAISTIDGHLIASIPAGTGPHGVCVWPEPGRYSTGHTGVMR